MICQEWIIKSDVQEWRVKSDVLRVKCWEWSVESDKKNENIWHMVLFYLYLLLYILLKGDPITEKRKRLRTLKKIAAYI